MPTPDTFPTSEYGGPYVPFIEDGDPDWDEVISETKFDDGGVSYAIHADSAPRGWVIRYPGLLPHELKIVRDHRESAKGKFLGFTFKHPRTGEVFTDVHYLSFEVSHVKTNAYRVEIELIKRP